MQAGVYNSRGNLKNPFQKYLIWNKCVKSCTHFFEFECSQNRFFLVKFVTNCLLNGFLNTFKALKFYYFDILVKNRLAEFFAIFFKVFNWGLKLLAFPNGMEKDLLEFRLIHTLESLQYRNGSTITPELC